MNARRVGRFNAAERRKSRGGCTSGPHNKMVEQSDYALFNHFLQHLTFFTAIKRC
ncbi:hypothetical protein N0M98_09225 [Paenibacillus doosanensis]|nr:hypothetical protein [Paenibacillus doosanensis]